MTSTTQTDSPFHLVPCSPFIGTTVPSPAPRSVPDIGETADTLVTESPKSVAGQHVPQTPVNHSQTPSSALHLKSRNMQAVAATPEQEVPRTPLQTETIMKKKATPVRFKPKEDDSHMPSQSTENIKEINFFSGDDNDIFG